MIPLRERSILIKLNLNKDAVNFTVPGALSGLGLGVRDRETSSVVGLCLKAYPDF